MPVTSKKAFDYSKLYGRMREKNVTQYNLAKEITITEAALNNKLTGKSYFSNPEVFEIARILKIPDKDLKAYFFTLKVQKAERMTT